MRRVHPDKFTLIEMLVVIAIISILAAMLSPALRRTMAMGIGAKCTSQIRQCGIAVAMYAGDYNDYLAPFTYSSRSWLSAPNSAGGLPTLALSNYAGNSGGETPSMAKWMGQMIFPSYESIYICPGIKSIRDCPKGAKLEAAEPPYRLSNYSPSLASADQFPGGKFSGIHGGWFDREKFNSENLLYIKRLSKVKGGTALFAETQFVRVATDQIARAESSIFRNLNKAGEIYNATMTDDGAYSLNFIHAGNANLGMSDGSTRAMSYKPGIAQFDENYTPEFAK